MKCEGFKGEGKGTWGEGIVHERNTHHVMESARHCQRSKREKKEKLKLKRYKRKGRGKGKKGRERERGSEQGTHEVSAMYKDDDMIIIINTLSNNNEEREREGDWMRRPRSPVNAITESLGFNNRRHIYYN